ncbi:MAG: hypothetical protein ACLQVY_21690 [Limisphaerales bacterium]
MADKVRLSSTIDEIVGKVRARLGCSEAEARNYLTEHIKEFAPEVRDRITTAFFMEALEKKNAEDKKKLENLKSVREALEDDILGVSYSGKTVEVEKGAGKPAGTATPPTGGKVPVLGAVAMGVLEKLMNDFGDDMTGGMEFLKKQFTGIPEPDRSELYKTLCEQEGQMPKEARQKLAMLAFKCDAGREQMLDNLDRNKANCPPELRRGIFGD